MKTANDFYKEANDLYERGEFKKAVELYSEAITRESNYKFFYNRGLALCCLERYSEGKLDILKTLELKPEFVEGWYILGLCKEYLNDLDGAKEDYEKALSLNPDFKDAQNRLEICKSKKQKQTSPLISGANSHDCSATLEEVKTLEKDGKYAEALTILEENLRKDPDNFQLLETRRVIVGKVAALYKGEIAVFGFEELKDALDRLVITPLKFARNLLYQAPIAQSSKGIILHGPPGCGKTMLTKAIANEEGIILVEIILSEILNMWAGESEKRLTEMFNKAKDIARQGNSIILFIDELDALGFARNITPEPHESSWSRDLRTTFLKLFDEIQDISNLIIVGATNRLWSVDEAFKRPGRLGACIMYCPPPDEEAREKMLRHYSQWTPGHDGLDFKKLAKMTRWFSGDDIRSVCRDVHLEIAREIIKNKMVNAVAKTEDYEKFIVGKIPQTISWLHKVATAYLEGKIENYELEKQLKEDIASVLASDSEVTKTNEEEHETAYIV